MRIKVCVFLVFLAASTCVVGLSKLEADVFLKEAQQEYDKDNYRLAVMKAEIAKEMYSELGDTRGIANAQNIISLVAGLHTKQQMAQMYFTLAGNEYCYTQDRTPDLSDYERCLGLSKTCIEYADLLTGEDRIYYSRSCQELEDYADTQIQKIIGDKKRDADQYYLKAQDAFRREEYVLSRKYALNCSNIYTDIGDEQGISKCAAVLASVDEKIEDVRINAAASYDKALDYYASAMSSGSAEMMSRLGECVQYASASYDLYRLIKMEEKSEAARKLKEICEENIDTVRQQKLREASNFYQEAQTQLVIQNCVNATIWANRAKDIYNEFLAEAREKEKDLPDQLKIETKFYEGKVAQVNEVIREASNMCTYDRLLIEAEKLYNTASESYSQNNLPQALAFARNAKTLYAEMNPPNYLGMSKCDSLIDLIQTRMDKLSQGAAVLNSAYRYYNTADFENAYIEAQRAKSIYRQEWAQDKIEEVDELMGKISEGREKKKQANDLVGRARDDLRFENWEGALETANQANNIYREINYTLGIKETQQMIKVAQEQVTIQWEYVRNIALAAGSVLLVLLILVYQWNQRRKSLEKEYETRIERQERQDKIKEDEWSLQREEETKQRVEDELRRLIREERKITDEE
ncbi:MAG: hypothetical protein GF334_03535 [Candidatus Altiarchaeales archaeon]|nr:hypothetical protein [Candidatus Altiarchaeales archaeon]